jgi:hypothetical protein
MASKILEHCSPATRFVSAVNYSPSTGYEKVRWATKLLSQGPWFDSFESALDATRMNVMHALPTCVTGTLLTNLEEELQMRKVVVGAVLSLGMLMLGSGVASAQVDTSTVTYTISAVSLVEIAGDVNLTISSANSVGGGLANATDSTTYAITNNDGAKKIVGKLNSAMPANTTLALQLGAPASGTSAGAVTLTGSNQDLVNNIGAVNQTGVSMQFTFSATVDAALVSAGTKTLTLTIVNQI